MQTVANVVFSNGWIVAKGVYCAASDTRCHVATTTVERLVDYCKNRPPDPLTSAACAAQRIELIERNRRRARG